MDKRELALKKHAEWRGKLSVETKAVSYTHLIEYKKEGPVLGAGAKLFSVAGPVLVCGISSAVAIGIIYWLIGRF